jgi:hypothetical protein
MAVNHMVWVRFRPGLDAEAIAAHATALRALQQRVPGVRSVSVGRNFTDRANGYDFGICVILDDKAALAAYAVHPYHVEVATALRRDGEIMALDFEF